MISNREKFQISYVSDGFRGDSETNSKNNMHVSTNNIKQTNLKPMSLILQKFTASSTINSKKEISQSNSTSKKVKDTTRITTETSVVSKKFPIESTSDKANPKQNNNYSEHMELVKVHPSKDHIEKTTQRMARLTVITDAVSSTPTSYPGMESTTVNNPTTRDSLKKAVIDLGGHKSGMIPESFSTGANSGYMASNNREDVVSQVLSDHMLMLYSD